MAETTPSNELKVGDLTVNLNQGKVFHSDNEAVQLPNLTLRLLKILIKRSPEVVPQEEIINYVWGSRHITDETLQQRVRLLRKALNDNPSKPEYIVTVRSQGYKLIAPVSTIKSDTDNTLSNKTKQHSSQAVFAAILTLLLSVLLTWQFYMSDPFFKTDTQDSETKSTKSETPKVAIIPFRSKNNDDSSNMLADGLSNQLTLTLSYINEIFLIDQVTMNYYSSVEKSPFQIGKELELDSLIVGEVERKNSQVKIEIIMLDVKTESRIWSKMFDSNFENILQIQTQIIQEITQTLKVSLKPNIKDMVARPTKSTSAYDYFLQAQKYLSHLQREDNEIAIDLSKKALELDPEYADAHLMLGYGYLFKHGHWNASPDFIERAIEQANKAIELTPNSSNAYYLLGLAYHYKSSVAPGDWLQKTQQAYKKSLELNPNNLLVKTALAGLYYDDQRLDETLTILYETLVKNPKSTLTHLRIGTIFEDLNYNQIAIEWYEKALEIKPDYYRAMMNLSQLHQALGHQDKAMHYVDKVLERYPDKMDELFQKGDIYFDMQNLEMAEKTYLKAIQNVPENFTLADGYYITSYIYLAAIYKSTQRIDEYNSLRSEIESALDNEMKAFPDSVWNMVNMSLLSVLNQNDDKAIEWLNKALDKGFISDDWLRIEVLYRPLREQGRLEPFFQHINQVTDQQRQQLKGLNILQNLDLNINPKSL